MQNGMISTLNASGRFSTRERHNGETGLSVCSGRAKAQLTTRNKRFTARLCHSRSAGPPLSGAIYAGIYCPAVLALIVSFVCGGPGTALYTVTNTLKRNYYGAVARIVKNAKFGEINNDIGARW